MFHLANKVWINEVLRRETPLLYCLDLMPPILQALRHSYPSLALKLGWAGDLVLTVASGLTLRVVDAYLDTGIVGPVGAREADSGSSL